MMRNPLKGACPDTTITLQASSASCNCFGRGVRAAQPSRHQAVRERARKAGSSISAPNRHGARLSESHRGSLGCGRVKVGREHNLFRSYVFCFGLLRSPRVTRGPRELSRGGTSRETLRRTSSQVVPSFALPASCPLTLPPPPPNDVIFPRLFNVQQLFVWRGPKLTQDTFSLKAIRKKSTFC